MFRGANAPFLSLLLKKDKSLVVKAIKIHENLILMIEMVMVMKDKIMDIDLHVTSCPMLSMSVKISGRL